MGYRALGLKTTGQVQLRSRNDNDFNPRYPAVVKAMASLPDDTVIDGEVVALDESGRPSFNILQNYGSSKAAVPYLQKLYMKQRSENWTKQLSGGYKDAVTVHPF